MFKLLCACGNGGGGREDGGERRAEEAVWWGENTPIAPGWPGELHTYTYRERAHTRTAHTYRTCPQHPAVHRPSPPPPAGQRGAPRLPAQPGEAGLQVPAAHQGHRRRHLRQQHQVGAGRGRAPLSAALVEKEGRVLRCYACRVAPPLAALASLGLHSVRRSPLSFSRQPKVLAIADQYALRRAILRCTVPAEQADCGAGQGWGG